MQLVLLGDYMGSFPLLTPCLSLISPSFKTRGFMLRDDSAAGPTGPVLAIRASPSFKSTA